MKEIKKKKKKRKKKRKKKEKNVNDGVDEMDTDYMKISFLPSLFSSELDDLRIVLNLRLLKTLPYDKN